MAAPIEERQRAYTAAAVARIFAKVAAAAPGERNPLLFHGARGLAALPDGTLWQGIDVPSPALSRARQAGSRQGRGTARAGGQRSER